MADMKGCANIVYCDDVKYIQHDKGMGWNIFIKMELLTALPRALGKTVTDEQVIKIGTDICSALAFCEKRNLLHRDIKPQNVFVAPDGTYKLGDFGIAKTAERTTSGTKTGTYKYMAPEVYNNQPYGGKADIYSLGLVLYWLLNERRTPFLPLPPTTPTATEEDKARAMRFSGEPIPAPAHGSAELQRIVLKACAFDQQDRYQNANEMLQDLSQIQGYLGSSKNIVSNNRRASGISGKNDGLSSQTEEKADAASSDTTKSADSTVSAFHTSTSKGDENDEKTVSAFSTKHGEKRESSKETKKQNNPTKNIFVVLAAIAACVLLVVFLRGFSDNTGTDASQEDSGKWVLVRSTDYYLGELISQVEYQYGEHGTSAITSVYYDTYNDTETRQHILYEFDQTGNRVKAVTYDLSSNEMTQYPEYIRDQEGNLTESRTYSAGGVLIGSEESLPVEERHDVTLKSYRYENGEKSVETEDEYDHDGNLIKQTYFHSDGSPFFISEYSYDEN